MATPGEDRGEAEPLLAAALAAYAEAPSERARARVHAALLPARLLVPLGAVRGDEGTAMALATLVARDGRRALPAFTCVDALTRWRPDVRPVPVAAARVVVAALEQGCAALVVDPAGPVPFPVEGAALRSLADGYVPVVGAPGLDARVVPDVTLAAAHVPWPAGAVAALAAEPAVRAAYLLTVDGATAIGLDVEPGTAVADVAARLGDRLEDALVLVALTGGLLDRARALGGPLLAHPQRPRRRGRHR